MNWQMISKVCVFLGVWGVCRCVHVCVCVYVCVWVCVCVCVCVRFLRSVRVSTMRKLTFEFSEFSPLPPSALPPPPLPPCLWACPVSVCVCVCLCVCVCVCVCFKNLKLNSSTNVPVRH